MSLRNSAPISARKSPSNETRSSRRARDRASGASAGTVSLPDKTPTDNFLLLLVYPALLLLALVWATIHPLMDPDVWLHMSFGRYFLEQHTFPRVDVFSFTAAGREWISSGWAASVLMQALYTSLGAPALVFMVFALIVVAYLTIYSVAVTRWDNRGSIALVLILALLPSTLRFTPRPEVFSQIFLTLTFLCLLVSVDQLHPKRPAAPKSIWALPILFALWPNFHAAFLAGLIPVGLCAIWLLWEWRRTGNPVYLTCAAACAACGVTWMLNPYGPRIALLSQKIKALPNLKAIVSEWRPMFADGVLNQPWAAFAGIVALAVAAIVTVVKRFPFVRLWEIAVVVIFWGLELYEIRHTALATLVTVLVLARHLSFMDALLLRARWLMPSLVAAACLGFMALQSAGLFHFGHGFPSAQLDDSLLPFTATKYLKANRPPANLYNSYGPGGYLMYNLGPETKVFMDGRNDVYDTGTWVDFYACQDGIMSLDEVTSRYGVNSFFIYCPYNNSNPANLVNRLTAHPDWRLIYFDDAYALYVRNSEKTAAYIAPREFKFISPFHLEKLYKALQSPDTRQAALDEIRRAVEISNGSARSHLLASWCAEQMRDPVKAQQEMSLARQRNPDASIGTPK